MISLQPVRGTQDLLPETMRRHRHITETARRLAALYGFCEIATPVFEFTEVFARPIGEHTDIVSKEMYTFLDRGGEEITLRPEATAGIVRAVLSNGLTQSAPLKFFYTGPMFRYERPQKGRFRQFHQIDVEILGVPQPQADIELIALGWRVLNRLGIGQQVVVELNTLGDRESRSAYRDALVSYLSARQAHLSEESRGRLARNPLRILDSKDEGDRRIVAEAPEFSAFLNPASSAFFARVQAGLDQLGIAYRLNPRLVRGLDYYSHTVFEFVTTALGAQGTVLAGGRYDGLVELMGGPRMAGVGWAAGVERLAMLIGDPPTEPRPFVVIPIGEEAEAMALTIAETLRSDDYRVELSYSGNLSRRLRYANRIAARGALLIGEDERARNVVKVRDLDSGEECEVLLDPLLSNLRERLKALSEAG
jgi:histidyl-tRNA synthetase